MVVLSGSHTIRRSSRYALKQRLHNFNGTQKPDPSMNIKYLNLLRKKRRSDADLVDLDVTTPRKFDAAYYANLGKNLELLSTSGLLNFLDGLLNSQDERSDDESGGDQ
ncbi:hypothetical protein ACS0TY_029667 [Phlomoides rotata]